MLVTLDTSQVPTSLLKALAPSNMASMSFTLAVSHLSPSVGMGWLNASAPRNMYAMFVTRPVFQALMPSAPPLLNAVALENMFTMLVTLDTSQVPMSLLKALAPLNMNDMSFTLAVFHLSPLVGMGWLN